MRTRLDEIVCEEMKWDRSFRYAETEGNSVFPVNGFQLFAIAERAFFHGAEQAARYYGGREFKAEGIQPAPAEEKPCPHAVRVGGVCTNPACLNDRRVGQRRNSAREEATQMRWLEGYGEVWVCKGYRDIGKNRRSGTERRKP